MRLLHTQYLLAESENIRAVRIHRRRRKVRAVIDGLNCRERIRRRKSLLKAQGAEILADGLQRAAEEL